MTTTVSRNTSSNAPIPQFNRWSAARGAALAVEALAKIVREPVSANLGLLTLLSTSYQQEPGLIATGSSHRPIPLRIVDHISDSTVFGGSTENTLSSQAIYDVSIRSLDRLAPSLMSAKAHFAYARNDVHFSISTGDSGNSTQITGCEHQGALSLSASPIIPIEHDQVLFRVPLLQSMNLSNGEFNILVLSFSRARTGGTISHTKYVIEFRHRRWSLEINFAALTDNSVKITPQMVAL